MHEWEGVRQVNEGSGPLEFDICAQAYGPRATDDVQSRRAIDFVSQGRNDGLDSFRGQQSRREIREQKQTELRKRRGGREDEDEEEGEKVVRDQGDPVPHAIISCQIPEKGNQATL
ncbi:hypothetical protein Q8A67_023456 [Cirrhinus molitorella]|uniref:Uncharacterized protein n=1 Tax=Cirrhinus molitorella TaxID=172907 RepID=A0AA88P1V9_9TELE|nr:hypothetical protein Q8A67_023456 [Cirrhinus molitorella]